MSSNTRSPPRGQHVSQPATARQTRHNPAVQLHRPLLPLQPPLLQLHLHLLVWNSMRQLVSPSCRSVVVRCRLAWVEGRHWQLPWQGAVGWLTSRHPCREASGAPRARLRRSCQDYIHLAGDDPAHQLWTDLSHQFHHHWDCLTCCTMKR